MQVERREGYELQLVMAMVTGCQWDGATLALKSQQPVIVVSQYECPDSKSPPPLLNVAISRAVSRKP